MGEAPKDVRPMLGESDDGKLGYGEIHCLQVALVDVALCHTSRKAYENKIVCDQSTELKHVSVNFDWMFCFPTFYVFGHVNGDRAPLSGTHRKVVAHGPCIVERNAS